MQAEPSRPPPARSPAADAVRGRLMSGLSAVVAGKGYAAATIADIVREARVSKRTFYQHFADKEACFLASYGAASDRILGVIAAAADAESVQDRIHAATVAYFAALEAEPALTRSFLVEIHGAGGRALELRRDVHRRFAELLRRLVKSARREDPTIQPLGAHMATALVGAINELVMVALEQSGGKRLHELVGTAEALVRAVLVAPRSPSRGELSRRS
ncbi:MAG: helix-turn-helix domain-containing protein [Polyangiaceae bacterium]